MIDRVTASTLAFVYWTFIISLQQIHAQSDKGKTAGYVQVGIGGGPVDGTGKQKVSVVLRVEKGFHLIGRNVPKELDAAKLRVEFFQDGKPVQADIGYPVGTKVKNELVGEYTIYQGEVSIVAEVRRPPGKKGPLEAVIGMQGYPDSGAY